MKKQNIYASLLFILISISSTVIKAQISSSVVETSMPMGNTLTFQSDILSEERKVSISLPDSYHISTNRYPVIYILDAQYSFIYQYAFGITKSLTFLEDIPEVILVGIHNDDRNNDLTTSDSEYRGNADQFISFINEELKTYINSEYRTEAYSILIGHSAGGFFALHTLAKSPETFSGYIVIDPAMQIGDCLVLNEFNNAIDERVFVNNTLFTSMAGLFDETEKFYTCYEELVEMLTNKNPGEIIFSHNTYPDEGHTSTMLPGIQDGLRAMYDNFSPPEIINNLDTLVSHYRNLSERYGYSIEVPMRKASRLGFAMVDSGNPEEGLNVFEWYYENISQDAIAHYQLGYALNSLGRHSEALEELNQSIELDPGPEMHDFIVRMRNEVAEQISKQ